MASNDRLALQYVKTTEGVTIEVEVGFLPQQSSPARSIYGHVYHITIHNLRDHPIRLLRRNWAVENALGGISLVEGEGVIGQQPVIQPGGHFHYSSWTHVSTVIGKMSGAYTMMDLEGGTFFQAEVPEFLLIYPPVLN